MSSVDGPTSTPAEEIPGKLDISSEISIDNDDEILESETHSSKILEENLINNAEISGDLEEDIASNEKSSFSETQGSSDQKFHISDGSPRILEEDGWLDIIGSGDFKKKIIKGGNGVETRPKQGNSVILNYTCYKDDDVFVEKIENFEFFVGELDVVPGFDLVIPLMEEGEVAEILIPSRLGYGKLGREPDIPGECPLRYEVKIVNVEEIDEEKLSPSQAMALGDKKRDRGNFWYGRGEYLNSVTCYKRATEVLDAIQWLNSSDDNDEATPAIRQSVVEARIKVYNNIAAAQLKLESFDQALKSLDFVLRLQPKNVKAHYRKGKILSAKGMTDEAIVEMRKAAELEPETKIIQQELGKLLSKKKIEDKSQRAMYKRMFPESPRKSSSGSKIKQWLKHGSMMAGSCVALAIGIAAYRQYYS